jgi:Zn-dependent protease
MTVGGITFGFSLSLLIISIFIVWYLSSIFVESEFGNLENIERGLIIFAGISIFIVSILLHEMAHFIMAQVMGIELKRFIFSITDGPMLAALCHPTAKPMASSHARFKVAIAGPIISLVMASLFAMSWWVESQDISTELFPQKNRILLILYYAALGNLIFGLVNLIPAFPCDGVIFLTTFLERRHVNRQTDRSKDGLRVMHLSGMTMIFFCLITACYLFFRGTFLDGLWLILAVWIVDSDMKPYLGRRSV